jgi:hypothetical protein
METLRYFSELVGDEEVKDRAEPDAPIRRRPLAPPECTGGTSTRGRTASVRAGELRQIKPEHGLLIYGSLRPAIVRLRLYFNERKLKEAA